MEAGGLNFWLIACGILSSVSALGHQFVGGKAVLRPQLELITGDLLRANTRFMFFVPTAIFSMAAVFYFIAGFNVARVSTTFPSAMNLFLGIGLFYFAATSNAAGALKKLAPWCLFLSIGVLGFIGG